MSNAVSREARGLAPSLDRSCPPPQKKNCCISKRSSRKNHNFYEIERLMGGRYKSPLSSSNSPQTRKKYVYPKPFSLPFIQFTVNFAWVICTFVKLIYTTANKNRSWESVFTNRRDRVVPPQSASQLSPPLPISLPQAYQADTTQQAPSDWVQTIKNRKL